MRWPPRYAKSMRIPCTPTYLTRVDALSRNEQLLVLSVMVRIAERDLRVMKQKQQLARSRGRVKKNTDLCKGGSTPRVVDNVRDDATNVVVPLRIVHQAVLGSAFAVGDMGLEDTSTTLTACPDNATHLCRREKQEKSAPSEPSLSDGNQNTYAMVCTSNTLQCKRKIFLH